MLAYSCAVANHLKEQCILYFLTLLPNIHVCTDGLYF